MFLDENSPVQNEEILVIGGTHSGKSIASAILVGKAVETSHLGSDDKNNLLLLAVEGENEYGFWFHLAKTLGYDYPEEERKEDKEKGVTADWKKLCIGHLGVMGYTVSVYTDPEKFKESDRVLSAFDRYKERIILIDIPHLQTTFTSKTSKIIRTVTVDKTQPQAYLSVPGYSTCDSAIIVKTEHETGKPPSLVFHVKRMRGEAVDVVRNYPLDF